MTASIERAFGNHTITHRGKFPYIHEIGHKFFFQILSIINGKTLTGPLLALLPGSSFLYTGVTSVVLKNLEIYYF